MANRITDQGLQRSLDLTFGLAAVNPVNAMSVSNFGNVLAGTTSVAAAANKVCNAFNATPTRAGNVVTCAATFSKAQANFQITTICLHTDGAGVFTGVFGGIDGQAITKTSDFDLTITVRVTYATA